MLSDEDKSVMQQWIAAIQSDAREGMVSREQLRPVLDWLRTINTRDVTEFLGQITSLRMRKLITGLESLLGEKEGK